MQQKQRTEKEKIWTWGSEKYKEVNNNIKSCMKKAEEHRIRQCSETREKSKEEQQ